jgi:hypothetical protein
MYPLPLTVLRERVPMRNARWFGRSIHAKQDRHCQRVDISTVDWQRIETVGGERHDIRKEA